MIPLPKLPKHHFKATPDCEQSWSCSYISPKDPGKDLIPNLPHWRSAADCMSQLALTSLLHWVGQTTQWWEISNVSVQYAKRNGQSCTIHGILWATQYSNIVTSIETAIDFCIVQLGTDRNIERWSSWVSPNSDLWIRMWCFCSTSGYSTTFIIPHRR